MMYCSHCGKKVLDTMRFCPFCGAEIIIPEQDEDSAAPVSDVQPEKDAVEERFTFDMTEEETFPDAPAVEPRQERAFQKTIGETAAVSGNDLFMEADSPAEDEYDSFERSRQSRETPYERYRERDAGNDEDEAEDDYEGGFFASHWAGLLILVLLIALLGGGAFFAMSDPGQEQLAKISYPLPFIKAETYGKLGYGAYQAENFGEAGAYYERALAREPDNFNYAQSAAMAYISAKDNDKAAELLRKCIELEPKNPEPYLHLRSLYPDPVSRPAEITGILEKGYAETGDARLNGQ